MSKKRRLTVKVKEGSFIFSSADGNPIPSTMLFSTYRDQVVLVIMEYPNIALLLSLLEKSSKSGQKFVRDRKLWMRAMKRDYNEQFRANFVQTDHPSRMLFKTRIALDNVSIQPNRHQTYWKRLYELITRLPAAFNKLQEPAAFNKHMQESTSFRVTLLPPNTIPFPNAMFYNIYTARGNSDIFYYFPAYEPKQMLEINFDTGSSRLVSFNRDILNINIKKNPSSLWGFSAISHFGTGVNQFSPRIRMLFHYTPSQRILTSCRICSQEAFFNCSNCLNTAYCSKKCQKEDWMNHQINCN